MFRITKEADYGVMLMAFLSAHPPGQIHTAREIAAQCGLPLPMASKILRCLAHEGFLASHRGVAGGYSLKRLPEQTSVADVVRAIEGPISLVQCGAEPGACDQEPVCPTRLNWERISQEVESALERVSIAEMLPRCGPSTLVHVAQVETHEDGTPRNMDMEQNQS